MRENKDFMLGNPKLVCRWRLQSGTLPLQNRHVRALGLREIDGRPVSRNLVAWAKQQIEWSLAGGSLNYPDGVLMLIVDEGGQAAMTVGAYEPLGETTCKGLARRAASAQVEGEETGVAPETVWLEQDGVLHVCMTPDQHPSGSCSLLIGLAETLGIQVTRNPELAQDLMRDNAAKRLASQGCGVFFVSDEHGVLVASDCIGPRSQKFADGYQRLLDRAAGQKKAS